MAAPVVIRLGACQKSKKYGLGIRYVKYGAFGMSLNQKSQTAPTINDMDDTQVSSNHIFSEHNTAVAM